MAVQPVHHRGDVVKLQRVEDTNDRFVRELAWLAHVVVWNFPEEHWTEPKVRKIFACMGDVMEVDPQCIPGDDRSCLRLVVALCHPHVPNRIGVHTRSGRGIILRMDPTRFWPLAEQFDAAGDWIPFFGPPPPPPHAFGPALPHLVGGPPPVFGPAPPAPPHQQQQLQQQPQQQLHPGAFLGAAILCHSFLNAYPLPRMPALLILVHRPDPAPGLLTCSVTPVLLLTWHPTDALLHTASPPPLAPRVSSPLPVSRVSPPSPSRAARAPSRCDRWCRDEEQREDRRQRQWQICLCRG